MQTSKIEIFKRTELFRNLDDVTLRVLAAHAVEKRLKRGTVREVVSRALYRLQNQGLIFIEGKDIIIPDLTLLASYAEMEKM